MFNLFKSFAGQKMAQQSLLQHEFSICNDNGTNDLFTGGFDEDPCDDLYRLMNSMNEEDSSYHERNSTPYKRPSGTRTEVNDNTKPKLCDSEASVVQHSSSRVSKPKRKINNGEQSSKKQKTTEKLVTYEKRIDVPPCDNQQMQRSSSLNTERQIIDNLDAYNRLQEKLQAKYAETDKRLNFFQTELEHIKSVENVESYAKHRDGVANIKSELEKMVKETMEDLRLYEPEKCRLCLSENSPPRLLSVPCNHAFACYSCMRKYFRIVYSKNGGQEFCLKCKLKSDDLITL